MTNRYQKGLIYKIVCNDTNIQEFYVGSTCNFTKRKSTHKAKYQKEDCHYPIYKFIKDNGGWENWKMILIENFQCNSKLELEKREREIIESLKPQLNKSIPTRSYNEYYEVNREHYLDYKKQWYNENKEHMQEKQKEYYMNNKTDISQKKKDWATENQEKIKEKKNEWYQKNKERILKQRKQQYQENKK